MLTTDQVLDTLGPRILICLCGRPVKPRLAGAYTYGAPQAHQLVWFLAAFRGAREYLDEEHGIREVGVELLRMYVGKNVVEKLGKEVLGLEGAVYRILRRRAPGLVAGVRRPWKRVDSIGRSSSKGASLVTETGFHVVGSWLERGGS